MSLGLGDLNKKRRSTKSAKTSPENSKTESKPQTSWSRSRTARPWSSSDLQRSVRNRPRMNQADAAVSEEWMHSHAEHLFSIDFPGASRLMKLQAKLVELEEQVQDSICSTMKAIQSFCFGR